MSSVSSLAITNLKGATKQYALAPLTYIHGPNKSNKSTVVDGIKIALLGYHPDQAKTNAGTMELASADSMSVAVGFADGSTVFRSYTAGKSVKSDLQPADWKTDMRMLPSLDHSLYFGKTDNERVQQVINLSEGLGAESRVPAILAKFKTIKAKNHTALEEKVLIQLVSELPAYNPGTPVQLWLASLLEWAKDRAKSENTRTKGFENTNNILTEANAIDSLTITNNIEQLKKDLAAVQRVRDMTVQTHAKHVADVGQAFKNFTRQKELKASLELVKAPVPSAEAIGVQINQMKADLAPMLVEAEKLLSMGKETMGQVKVIDGKMRDINDARVAFSQKITDLEHLQSCPTCKAASEGWRIPAKASYQAEITALDTKLASLDHEKSLLNSKANDLRPKYTKLKAECDAKTTTIDQLQAQHKTAIQVESNIRHWTDELTRLGPIPETAPVLPPIDSPELPAIREQMSGIQAKISELEGAESERKRIAQVREIALESRAALELSKLLADTVREEQGLIVAEAFGPVLEIANQLVDGILVSELPDKSFVKTPIAYLDGRVGRFLPNGRFVSVTTFSGSELRLTQTAITAGLARQAKHKIAIIDETGTLDEPSLTKLIANAEKVVAAGLLDQLIMLGTIPPYSPFPASLMVISP